MWPLIVCIYILTYADYDVIYLRTFKYYSMPGEERPR